MELLSSIDRRQDFRFHSFPGKVEDIAKNNGREGVAEVFHTMVEVAACHDLEPQYLTEYHPAETPLPCALNSAAPLELSSVLRSLGAFLDRDHASFQIEH